MNSEFEQPENDSNKGRERNREELALDDAIQSWATEKTAKPDHLAAQKLHAIELLKDESHIESSLSPQLDHIEMKRKSSIAFLGVKGWYWAIVATLLMAVGISWVVSSLPNIGSPNLQTVESPRRMLDANALTLVSINLDQQRTVLNRFHEVFGKDLESVSEVNGEVKVTLRDGSVDSPRNAQGSKYVSVRLVVISRDTNSSGTEWDLVHDVSMLAEQEHRVDIPMSGDGLEFSVWTYLVGDGLVSVDLKVKFKSPIEIKQSTSLLQKIGESKVLFTTTRNGTEYRLYQTINQIKSDDDLDQSTQFERGQTSVNEWAVL